tara:strand:- start:571 stop:1242 length:672 start_codon:yes stop_codon:yes gene_type:complete
MNQRSDRLYNIIHRLRDGRLHTATDLSRVLGVTPRTIYRDMDRLTASGIDISGTPGLGYRSGASVNLPALNLTNEELEVLHLGLAVIGEGADPALQSAALSLSKKIEDVLPEEGKVAPQPFGFAIYPFAEAARGFQHMPSIRAAIRSRQKLQITDLNATTQVIRPLNLDYWGRVWNCVSWSEKTDDFASFRLDLIDLLTVLPELFVDEHGKTLPDYRRRQPRY